MKSNEASSTAKVIAASTILLANDPRTAGEVAPGAAELCESFLGNGFADRLLAASARNPLTRIFWRAVERMTLPGILSHYWRRKRWIERRCRQATTDGFQRLVIVGAGLDSLGIRLAREAAQLEVIELDHPATQMLKRNAVRKALPENLRFEPVDLTKDTMPENLLDSKPTLVVIEGLLMYLSPQDVSRLFTALHALPRVLVIFTFMTRWPDGSGVFRPHSWLIERWLSWRKEPFHWSIEPERMQAFLAEHDFKLLEMAGIREVDDGFPNNTPRPDGEVLVVCSVGL